MAINKRGYQEIAKKGAYGICGLSERGAITLTVQGTQLFSKLPRVRYARIDKFTNIVVTPL